MHTPYRVGIGHDTHRLIPGDGVHLGGVFIPHDKKLLGHSDADVLLHAVTDAILGAAALGDIGEMFPDTDEANRGRSSVEMLQLALKKVQNAGWQVQNVDGIVFAQRPKLSAYKAEIALKIAETLQITPQQVNVKAKTGEGVGLVGEEIVIEAQCVALLISGRNTAELGKKAMAATRPATNVSIPGVSPSIASTKARHVPQKERISTKFPHCQQDL